MTNKKMAIWKKNPFASKCRQVRPLLSDTNTSTSTTTNMNINTNTNASNNSAAADGIILFGNINPSSPRGGIEYLQARRAFLNSYELSYYHQSWMEKLKKSVKKVFGKIKEGVVQLVVVLEKKSTFRIRVRVYRLNFAWPNGVFVRCFLPWPCKRPQVKEVS